MIFTSAVMYNNIYINGLSEENDMSFGGTTTNQTDLVLAF